MDDLALPLPDETALAGREYLDEGSVGSYDRKAAFDPSPDLDLLVELGLSTTSTLIDFGAGTGVFALAAAARCERVVAVDPSPQMVTAMREKTEERRIENVELVQAGFISYQHAGEPVDFVYSRNALHHLPDFWKALALRNIAAVLRPGGSLRLRDITFAFDPIEADRYLSAWFSNAASQPAEGWTRSEYEAHVQTEYSTFTWLLEPMIERAGFVIRDAQYGALKIYAEYVCEKSG